MPHVIPQKRDQLRVRISERAFRRIVAYAYRYANSSLNSKSWREVYGILIGTLDKQQGGIVNIIDAIPMVVGERAGVNFEARQYVDMASIDASLFEKTTKQGLAQFLVGWWHTHPGFGFFFSQVDTMTHLGYQIANPHAVGLIFDHTQLTAFDCGMECLHLDDPTDLMRAGHDFVIFELENYETLLKTTRAWAEKLQVKLKEAEKILVFIDGHLRHKVFAQLQRNFGILLVRKNISKETKEEILGEDEETWIWDEKYLETMYRIPTFRKKIEHLLESGKNKKQKLEAAEKVHQFLERPKQLLSEILSAFWSRLNSIAAVHFYLDTRERQIIETFDQRLTEYWRILNSLLRKAGDFLGQDLGYRITSQQEQKPKITQGESTKKVIAVSESNVGVEVTANAKRSTGDTLSQTPPVQPVVKIPERIVLPIRNTPENPNQERGSIQKTGHSGVEKQGHSQKMEIMKIVVDIIRREKQVSISNVASTYKVPSKIIWELLVDLDIDGSIECDFDGDLFVLHSDVSKFDSLMEQRMRDRELEKI